MTVFLIFFSGAIVGLGVFLLSVPQGVQATWSALVNFKTFRFRLAQIAIPLAFTVTLIVTGWIVVAVSVALLVAAIPGISHGAADTGVQFLGQVLDRVAALVLLAALDQCALAEGLDDGLAQRLGQLLHRARHDALQPAGLGDPGVGHLFVELGADEVVAKAAGLLLGQHDHLDGFLGKPLEHGPRPGASASKLPGLTGEVWFTPHQRQIPCGGWL